MNIIEAANSAPRTQGDEKAAMAENGLLQNFEKLQVPTTVHTQGSRKCQKTENTFHEAQ